jgi:FixJ family two-component response regulator
MKTEKDELIIWLFDDEETQLRTYKALLQNALPCNSGARIQAAKALPHKEDYLKVVNDKLTGCLIVDQRMKETGEADYTGIELAKYLRALNDKLPIYILTNYDAIPDEFSGSEWSVEDILSKKKAGESDTMTIFIARLLRRLKIYQNILGEREQRFSELLRKSLDKRLTKKEINELDELRYQRASTILAEESNQEVLQSIGRIEELIDKLSAETVKSKKTKLKKSKTKARKK